MNRRLIFALTGALLATGITGCSLGPNYKRPEVNAPAAFRGENATPDAKSLADLGWWELYRDPVLEKLITTALKQNYDVRIALARVEEFRAAAGVAGIGSIPLASINSNATRSRISGVGPTPLPANTPLQRSTYNAELDVSYEIDLWRRIANINAAARADLLASEFARDTTRVSVVANVAVAYFTLRSLDRQLAVTRRTVATREKFLELTHAQFSRGVVSGLDVNRAEAILAVARATVPDLQRQIAQTENQLQVLLGENPAAIMREAVDGPRFFPMSPEVPAGLPATLLERRPDLRQAEHNLIGANARLKSVKASLFPTISLTGVLGSQSKQLADLFSGPAKIWSLGLGLLQPLIDPSRNVYQVDIYTAREKQAILQYQQSVAQAFREVADALAAREGYAELLRVQDEQVAALREASGRVLKRYAIGYSSYFEVIDADRDLFNAELQLAQAYQNNLISLVQLYKALGGGWQMAADDAQKAGGGAQGQRAAPVK
jgi:outer membrane protein, multidrug efflux system